MQPILLILGALAARTSPRVICLDFAAKSFSSLTVGFVVTMTNGSVIGSATSVLLITAFATACVGVLFVPNGTIGMNHPGKREPLLDPVPGRGLTRSPF